MDVSEPKTLEAQASAAPPWRRRGVIWIVYFVVWTIGLLMPMEPTTGQSVTPRYIAAKILHVVAYAGLAGLSGWLHLPSRWRWLLLFVIMAHAPATELLQLNIQGRTGKLLDVGFDHLGVGIGLLLTWRWWSAPDEQAA